MTTKDSCLPKLYMRLTELSERWHLDIPELMHYAISNELPVVIDFSGHLVDHVAQVCSVELDPSSPETGITPGWALMLAPDVLKLIASKGKATIHGGFRRTSVGLEAVFLACERVLSSSDLVVPMEIVTGQEKLSKTDKHPSYLKQIGALSLVIADHGGYQWGEGISANKIAHAVEKAFAKMPKEVSKNLITKGLSPKNLEPNIRAGLDMLQGISSS